MATSQLTRHLVQSEAQRFLMTYGSILFVIVDHLYAVAGRKHKPICALRSPDFWKKARDAGVTVLLGEVIELRAMETYKTTKIDTNYAWFGLATMVTSKIIAETIENTSEFLGSRLAANKLFHFGVEKP